MLRFTALNLNYSGKPWQFKKRIVKVAYYSFQKRKITFLELKFKANRSFSFGSIVVITVKRNDINPHYPGKEI